MAELRPITSNAPRFVTPEEQWNPAGTIPELTTATARTNIAYDEEYEDLKARILAGIEQKKRDRDGQIASLQEGAKRDINPWLKAGMAGIRGQDPFAAYQAAQLPIEAREAKIRELSSLDFDDEHTRLIDLSKVVAQRMKAAQTANKKWEPKAKVIQGRLVEYNPNTETSRVLYENIHDSPLYGRIQEEVVKESLNERLGFGNNEAARQAWIKDMTEKRFSDAIQKDSSVLFGDTPAKPAKPAPGSTPAKERVTEKAAVEIQPSISETSPTDVILSPPAINPGVSPNGARSIAPKKNLEMIRQEMAKMSANDPRRKILQAQMDEQLAPSGQYQPPEKIKEKGFAISPTGQPMPVNTRLTGAEKARTTPLPTPVVMKQPILSTPAQVELDKKDAVAMSKYFETMPTQLDSINKGLATVGRLHQATKDSDTVYGPAANFWEQAGGIAAYFDPQGKLGKQAAASQAYYGELMNLVRDKIAALGAGTAVSNLDLIVTQKSLGDLTQTQQGRMQLLGVLKATMLAEQQLLQQRQAFKTAHPEITSLSEFSTKFKQQVEKDGPLYAIMPYNISKPSTKNRSGKANPLTEYVPIMRDRWIEQARKVNPKATDAALLVAWKNWADADNQVKMMGWKK